MIVKTRDDVIGTKGEASGNGWWSLRLLHEEDGMGVTLTDSFLEPGFDMVLWQKNHFEACYCLEGEGTLRRCCCRRGRAPSRRQRQHGLQVAA